MRSRARPLVESRAVGRKNRARVVPAAVVDELPLQVVPVTREDEGDENNDRDPHCDPELLAPLLSTDPLVHDVLPSVCSIQASGARAQHTSVGGRTSAAHNYGGSLGPHLGIWCSPTPISTRARSLLAHAPERRCVLGDDEEGDPWGVVWSTCALGSLELSPELVEARTDVRGSTLVDAAE